MTAVAVGAALALLGIGAMVAARRRLTLATVCGSSMSPTFADGERVLAVRAFRYRVDDVVVFRFSGPIVAGDPPYRIKRVAAVAGDPAPAWLPAEVCAERTVPPGHVVVLGDNARSQDSRHLGYISIASVSGRVVPSRANAGNGQRGGPRPPEPHARPQGPGKVRQPR